MKYNWNKEQFIQDYDLLKSSRKMADKYKVNRKAILSFAKQIGYQNTNMGVKITEKIKPYLREQYYYKSSTELSKELNISASTIAGFWRREGLKGKKRRVYHYNEHYFQNIDAPEKAYWLGFLAADGCICHNFQINTLHAVNVSITGFFKNLLRFQQVLAEEGINATLIEDKRNYKSEDKFGALCFTSKIGKAKFLNYIYSDATIFLERKYKLAQKFIELVSINDTSWKLKK